MEDHEIVALYFRRDEAALACSAQRYGGYCHRIAWNILSDHEDAEECVNDVWLRAWQTIPPQKPAALGAYLGKLARSLAIDRLRSKQAQKRGGGQYQAALEELADCLPSPDGVEEMAEAGRVRAVLENWLWGLSREKRQLFLLRYFYFLPVAEAASALGFSQSKAASALMRLRRELGKVLEREDIL